jgi:hypothetical protein
MSTIRRIRRLSFWLGGLALSYGMITLPALGQQQGVGNQLPNPRINTVTPPGGKVGTTVEVVFNGTDLEDPESLFFSHPGIKGEPISTEAAAPDPNKKEKNKKGAPPSKPVNSKWKVTIAPNVPVGHHDVRVVNKWGVSNPRTFVVGDLNEVMEKEPNNDVAEAQRVEINTTINGSLSGPLDVDYYVFKGKKGQRVVMSALTSSIDSRMTVGLQLFSGERRLAENRNYAGNDALLDYTLPDEGDYLLRVFEFTHVLGNSEYFYRLSITTAPWIDAVYPPCVEPGKQAKLTVYGRNLPGGKPDPTAVVNGRVLETLSVTVDPPKEPAALTQLNYSGHIRPPMSSLDGFEYRIKNESGTSNPYLLTFARAPVVLDNEKNDTPETAQEVTLPCEIAGRIEKKRDRDWYAFSAKKGEIYSIEVFADRIGSPADMAIALRQVNPAQEMSDLDDSQETLTQVKFFTRTTDPPHYRFEVKADGKYQIQLRSQDGDVQAGPRHLYRVVITPERPDFRLVVMPPDELRPDSGQLMKGGNQYYSVLAWRLDGFNAPITITADGLPPGVTCEPQTIGPNQRQVPVVVTAKPDAAPGLFEIKFKGTATIQGKQEVREARPASITWAMQAQQNIPAHSRLDRNLLLAVRDQAPFNLTATIDKADLKPGDKANVTVKLTRLWPDFKANLAVTGLDLPPLAPNQQNQPGITINNNQPIQLAPGKDEFKAVVEVKPTMGPGIYNLVLKGVAQIPYNKDPMAKQKPNISVVLPSVAFTVNVIPKELAKLSLSTTNVTAKAGSNTEVVVKVSRLHDYDGEYKVKLMLPPNAAGVSVDEVTIPPGQNEAKLVVKVTPEAPPVNLQNLVVQATAMYMGKVPTMHETKLNVNVVKK